jgi:anti-sigma regulatory factor (Ser/Thr protein kinase)
LSAGGRFGVVRLSANVAIPVQDSTGVGEARRAAAALSGTLALDPTVAGHLALVVTEAANNLVKHGGGGSILLSAREDGAVPTVEMLAIDKGPGMDDVGRCMVDGYSTAGSPGNGLGAIARHSTLYEIYSSPGLGTVVLAQLSNPLSGPRKASRPAPDFEVGAVSVPKAHEAVCGDAWIAQPTDRGIRVLLADGLGHGEAAAEAANAALEIAANHLPDALPELLERIHAGLRSTRGAAVSVAEIDLHRGIVSYAGLGNVAGVLVVAGQARRQMVSYNGTAGHQALKIGDFTYPCTSDSILVLHSDGLATHWSVDKYPGLYRSHSSIIAAVLFRDFERGSDDTTVVVVRRALQLEASP